MSGNFSLERIKEIIFITAVAFTGVSMNNYYYSSLKVSIIAVFVSDFCINFNSSRSYFYTSFYYSSDFYGPYLL